MSNCNNREIELLKRYVNVVKNKNVHIDCRLVALKEWERDVNALFRPESQTNVVNLFNRR